jgi:Asp-tRNA(Asn)/Glu-tRNA(Gln) amidotransferase A subunit family amidase
LSAFSARIFNPLQINLQISRKLQDGELLPSDVCAACLHQAEKLKTLNMFVRLTKEVAKIQAKEADSRYKNGN